MENKERVRIAMIEVGRRVKPLEEWDHTFSYPIEGDGNYVGLTLFDVSKGLAGVLCQGRPDRYRLLGEKPIDVKINTIEGGTRWGKIYPWKRSDTTKAARDDNGDPIKGEVVHEFVWTSLEPAKVEPKKLEQPKK